MAEPTRHTEILASLRENWTLIRDLGERSARQETRQDDADREIERLRQTVVGNGSVESITARLAECESHGRECKAARKALAAQSRASAGQRWAIVLLMVTAAVNIIASVVTAWATRGGP